MSASSSLNGDLVAASPPGGDEEAERRDPPKEKDEYEPQSDGKDGGNSPTDSEAATPAVGGNSSDGGSPRAASDSPPDYAGGVGGGDNDDNGAGPFAAVTPVVVEANPGHAPSSSSRRRRPPPAKPPQGGPTLREMLEKPREFYADTPEYRALLRQSFGEDFSDLAALNILYEAPGRTEDDLAIVVVQARRLPDPATVDYDRLLRYFIRTMHDVVCYPYELVYVHSGAEHRPAFAWLRKCYGLFSRTYKKNLMRLHVVHPNWKFKVTAQMFRPFLSHKFWRKLHYYPKLADLFTHIPDTTLLLPSDVYETDYALNGGERLERPKVVVGADAGEDSSDDGTELKDCK